MLQENIIDIEVNKPVSFKAAVHIMIDIKSHAKANLILQSCILQL